MWELTWHITIVQWDILEFIRNPRHVSPSFPDGYWPEAAAPDGEEAWGELLERYRPAMQLLDPFTHPIVVWWADRHDDEKSRTALQCEPPYALGRVHGVFATRAEDRPNPIAITTCRMLCIDEEQGVIQVADIDALHGTPVVDLKPYHPVCDRVQEARILEWLSDWADWMPEEGLGL